MRWSSLVLLVACGHGAAEIPDDASVDLDASSMTEDATGDAIAERDGALDPDGPAGCGTLAADPADVFVDGAATLESLGTMACPFHTIDEALALAAPATARTIHVAGGEYVQGAIVAIPAKVRLSGASEASVAISGGGTCAVTASPCTLTLEGGAGLDHVTVTNATGDAIVVTGGTGAAMIDHATASDAKRFGIAVRSASLVLDHATVSNNKQDGLNAKQGTITVTASDFRNNAQNALDIDQGATLSITGGNVDSNQFDAIFLHNGSSFAPLAHTITGVSLKQNLGFGIFCAANASCTVRDTTMFGNEIGIVFDVGSTNALDLGTQASPGNNAFAGPLATERNIRAGLCFEQSGAVATQLVEGNTWRACAPPSRKTGPFCRSNNTYSDLAFVPAVVSSGTPVIPPIACTAVP